jgi:hypothetical protein
VGDLGARLAGPLGFGQVLWFDVEDKGACAVLGAGSETEGVPLDPGDGRDVDKEEVEGVEGVAGVLGDLDLQVNEARLEWVKTRRQNRESSVSSQSLDVQSVDEKLGVKYDRIERSQKLGQEPGGRRTLIESSTTWFLYLEKCEGKPVYTLVPYRSEENGSEAPFKSG